MSHLGSVTFTPNKVYSKNEDILSSDVSKDTRDIGSRSSLRCNVNQISSFNNQESTFLKSGASDGKLVQRGGGGADSNFRSLPLTRPVEQKNTKSPKNIEKQILIVQVDKEIASYIEKAKLSSQKALEAALKTNEVVKHIRKSAIDKYNRCICSNKSQELTCSPTKQRNVTNPRSMKTQPYPTLQYWAKDKFYSELSLQTHNSNCLSIVDQDLQVESKPEIMNYEYRGTSNMATHSGKCIDHIIVDITKNQIEKEALKEEKLKILRPSEFFHDNNQNKNYHEDLCHCQVPIQSQDCEDISPLDFEFSFSTLNNEVIPFSQLTLDCWIPSNWQNLDNSSQLSDIVSQCSTPSSTANNLKSQPNSPVSLPNSHGDQFSWFVIRK